MARTTIVQERADYALTRKRMEIAFVLFLGMVLILAGRLAYVQWLRGPDFALLASRMQTREYDIEPNRGNILDRNGVALAQDVLAKSIAVNPQVLPQTSQTADCLSDVLNLNAEERKELHEKLKR